MRSSRTMRKDLRESPEYGAVAEHLRRLHEPAFGRPHHVTDLVTTADASRIVVAGSVYDELDGLPRTVLYEVRDAGLGAEMADAQGSGTVGSDESGLPSWYPGVDTGTREDAWRGLWLYTPASGELAKVSPDGLNVWEAAWSGSGHVLAITSEQPSEDDWYSAVLSRLDISTGEMTQLLGSDVQLGLPAGTSDGTRAAVVEAVCSDRWIVAGDLILLDLVAGTRCAVDTAGADGTAVQWIDGTRLGYIGRRHLGSVAGLADAGG